MLLIGPKTPGYAHLVTFAIDNLGLQVPPTERNSMVLQPPHLPLHRPRRSVFVPIASLVTVAIGGLELELLHADGTRGVAQPPHLGPRGQHKPFFMPNPCHLVQSIALTTS
ncbi:hypothetical protein AURDEDRAFT_175516 [Auricularia subglabra TFB-10046 SS5]|uniref:Uncharacterized protein n=1 Tax=Auricularia subglabra (strain TFB-10046 / SS5) TaxID=717982 RepID=J0WT63_AURST|nr:hypothetical protein AURDEDRAFT_175516 [Auricularia subglabra TFB-10046 SS5]